MRISDWSSDVCSSDLCPDISHNPHRCGLCEISGQGERLCFDPCHCPGSCARSLCRTRHIGRRANRICSSRAGPGPRSEEHTSELQSLMRISYAVFCLKKKNKQAYSKYNILIV